ncbi:MAG: hypothetical protein WAL56_23815 [Candidatus Sulfotelmatobacter sp.]
MSKRCSAKNRNGKRCGAWAAAGTDKCALHLDPELAAKLGSKHGRRAAHQPDLEAAPMEPPKTAGDIRDVLGNAMAQVHSRTMDTRTASTLAYLATSLLRAIEVSDIESRLDELEASQRAQEREFLQSSPMEREQGGKS